jgi:hypothetical protein
MPQKKFRPRALRPNRSFDTLGMTNFSSNLLFKSVILSLSKDRFRPA